MKISHKIDITYENFTQDCSCDDSGPLRGPLSHTPLHGKIAARGNVSMQWGHERSTKGHERGHERG